jgi:TPP-dependent pyruvate/acetoin dehydrogenase alpha subunit
MGKTGLLTHLEGEEQQQQTTRSRNNNSGTDRLDSETLLRLYRKMILLRRFEEKVTEVYMAGFIPGLAHPYIGEEAVAIGVCDVLKKDDYIISNHRGHGHSIAKGIEPREIMGELLGKKTGVVGGIGGSMHAADLSKGVIFSTAIVGGGIPIATGVGLKFRNARSKQVCVCFFGDGAANIGSFHEGINLAAIWKLPVIFVCENNFFATSMPQERATGSKTIAERGKSYGIPGVLVDGMNVIEVRNAAAQAVERARNKEGPSLLECRTYRFKGHGVYDTGLAYRTKEEVSEWTLKDPITRLGKMLIDQKIATPKDIEAMDKEAVKIAEDSFEYAKASPYPSVEEMKELTFVQKNRGEEN